jgi:hypothetical protein
MEVSRMKTLGWEASTPLLAGLKVAYQAFLDHLALGDARL